MDTPFSLGFATDASSEFSAITDKPVYRLDSDLVITQEMTLTNDAHWIIKGRTAVGNDNSDSTVLYIEEGTTVIGEDGDDFLVVRRGSKIEASGTATLPDRKSTRLNSRHTDISYAVCCLKKRRSEISTSLAMLMAPGQNPCQSTMMAGK